MRAAVRALRTHLDDAGEVDVEGVPEQQWRVTWFPPDTHDRTFTGSEKAVRAKAEEVAAWAPFIERRTIYRSSWITVRNDSAPMTEGL